MSIGIEHDQQFDLFHVGLVITVCFLVLNGHLRSRNKILFDIVFGVLWFSLVAIGFIFFGWRVGTVGFLSSLLYGVISKPIAVVAAQRILGYGTIFRPPFISAAQELSTQTLLAHHQETERRIIPISERLSMTKVLFQHGMKPEDLREQFHFLLDIGLGEIARHIISDGRQLRRLLRLRQRKLPRERIAARLIRWRWYVLVLYTDFFEVIVDLDGAPDFWNLDQIMRLM